MTNNSNKFINEFVGFQSELKSFIFRLTANKADAEDICHDTYIKSFQSIDSFKGQSSFKTWVFSIAVNIAKDKQRVGRRWAENAQDCCREKTFKNAELQTKMFQVYETSIQTKYEIREHIDMCFTCIIKTLPLDQQICFMLKNIYDFTVEEAVQITHLSLGVVKHAIADARRNMKSIFDGRCSLINKNGTCHQCSELNGIFNPRQKTQAEINKLKMSSLAEKLDSEKLFTLRTELVKAIDPLSANGTNLHNYLLESVASMVE
jgi:RNA polymerase sigma-70 factor (ECF subfamily)